MTHSISSTGPTLEVKISGPVDFSKRNKILFTIVEALNSKRISVLYIDYSQAEVQGTTEEAYAFGEKLGEALKPFEGLFVAVYVGDAARGSLLVDVSVMIAKKFGIRIRTFNDFDRMILQTSRHLTGVT